jgi:hypothetical protein
MFPQIARPVVGRVLKLKFDDAFAHAFSTHMARLFS